MIDDFKPVERPAKSLSATPNITVPDQNKDQAPTPPATPEPDFKTPDQVAASDEVKPSVNNAFEPPAKPADKAGWRNKLALHWPPGKKEYIVLAAVLILLAGSFTAWTLLKPAPKPKPVAKQVALVKKEPPKPTTVPSNLTGLPVDPAVNNLPVTAVMIENSLDARPQSGLGQAGVVFEAVAEGGVTRFLALFQDTSPGNVGPIRSARPYYVSWEMGFDAPYAHVGGSADGLNDIIAWHVKDMNQFYNGAYYHRTSSRAAPHNVYTSIATLNQLEAKKGYGASSFTSWPRKAEQPSKQPTAGTINLHLSGPVYDPTFTYDAASNSYKRAEYGSPHIDANTNQQISPKVVIAIVVPESRGALDATGAYYSNYQTIGSGQAYVFQDGTVTVGSWNKTDNSSNISFSDSAGNPLKLNAGQTWITAITGTGNISYTP